MAACVEQETQRTRYGELEAFVFRGKRPPHPDIIRDTIRSLEQNPHIRALRFDQVAIDNPAAEALAEIIATCATTGEVHFLGVKMGYAALKKILGALGTNTTVTSVRLDDMPVNLGAMERLRAALQANGIIRELRMNHSRLNEVPMAVLAQGLADHPALTHLDLACMHLGNDGIYSLAQSIGAMPHLVYLNLANNPLGALGGHCIADALETHGALKELNLENTGMNARSALPLATALEHNDVLETLDVSRNKIGHAGMHALCVAGQRTQALKRLGLRWIALPMQSRRWWERTLPVDMGLHVLNLQHNIMGLEGVQHIARFLEHTQTLRYLNLGGCSMDDPAAAALAAGLEVNTTLVALDIHDNQLRDEGIACLEHVLETHHTLHIVRMQTQWGHGPYTGRMVDICKKNPALLHVRVGIERGSLDWDALKRHLTENRKRYAKPTSLQISATLRVLEADAAWETQVALPPMVRAMLETMIYMVPPDPKEKIRFYEPW